MLDEATDVAGGSHNRIKDFLHKLAPSFGQQPNGCVVSRMERAMYENVIGYLGPASRPCEQPSNW